MALGRRRMTEPVVHPSPATDSDGRRPPGTRALTVGAEVAERVARASGVDRLVNAAAEEAIVRALQSPAVIRAFERALESHAVTAELNSDEIGRIAKQALESHVGEAVWTEFLESDQVQMLVERIAGAPEIRAAIAAQGAGLITDVGVRLTGITEELDDGLERIVRRHDPESELDQAGLATRTVAAIIDLALLFAGYSLLSGVFASIIAAIFGKPLSVVSVVVLSAIAVVGGGAIFAAFWALAGQTPGMRFLAIRVTYQGSHDLTFGRSVGRVFAVLLSLVPLGLGYLAVLRDPLRRSWADRMTGTEVIYDNVVRSSRHARSRFSAGSTTRHRSEGA